MNILTDWIAILLLLAAYLGLANGRFSTKLRQYAHKNDLRPFLIITLLFIPYLLVTLPRAAADPAAFWRDLAKMILFVGPTTTAVIYRPGHAKRLHPLDIFVILAIWFPIEFGWLPDVQAHLATGIDLPIPMLTAVVLILLLYLVIRPLPGIGYTFKLSRSDGKHILNGLTAYTLIGIPIGLLTRFLIFGIAPFDTFTWILAWPLGYLFTALPEELLFRGVIQNQLQSRLKNKWLALLIASVIFGLAHLNNGTVGYPVPNWMYVLMASLAGLAYGWTWHKTGKITAAAVVHATVNFLWGIFLGG